MKSISVRYIVDDIEAAIDFYTKHLGFEVLMHPARALLRSSVALFVSC